MITWRFSCIHLSQPQTRLRLLMWCGASTSTPWWNAGWMPRTRCLRIWWWFFGGQVAFFTFLRQNWGSTRISCLGDWWNELRLEDGMCLVEQFFFHTRLWNHQRAGWMVRYSEIIGAWMAPIASSNSWSNEPFRRSITIQWSRGS